MGGTLYLKDGNQPNRNNVCISGYSSNKPNYCLSNFENNNGQGYDFLDPDIGPVHFRTAEHYLHFQKMTAQGKRQHKEAWEKEPSPLNILKGIRDLNSRYFIQKTQEKYTDYKQWDEDKLFVQMQINASKYNQSDAFKATIMNVIEVGKSFGDTGYPATVIEDTSSKTGGQTEEIWGTGPGGLGTNILGNTQTAFAMMWLDKKISSNKTPSLKDFSKNIVLPYYQKAEKQYKEGVQVALQKVRKASGHDQGLDQPDTSKLSIKFVELLDPAPAQSNNLPKPLEFMNNNQTKKLVIQNGQVIDRQYRDNSHLPWQKGTDLKPFKDLEDLYKASLNPSPQAPKTPVAKANSVRVSNNHGYDHLWDANKSDKENVLAVLTDYSKANAFFPGLALFFTGHWNRHHRGPVKTAILSINGGMDVKKAIHYLRKDFNEVTDHNTSGSLARRLAYMEDKLGIKDSSPSPSSPSIK